MRLWNISLSHERINKGITLGNINNVLVPIGLGSNCTTLLVQHYCFLLRPQFQRRNHSRYGVLNFLASESLGGGILSYHLALVIPHNVTHYLLKWISSKHMHTFFMDDERKRSGSSSTWRNFKDFFAIDETILSRLCTGFKFN